MSNPSPNPKPGRYRINSQAIYLVVTSHEAFLELTTSATPRRTIRLEVPGLVQTSMEDVEAMETVSHYLKAGYGQHQHEELTRWMRHMEETHGLPVWRLRFIEHGELQRWKIDEEVLEWQEQQQES